MTIEKIVTGFIQQLKNVFKYTVYDEEVPQKFKKPSFFVQLVDLNFKRMTGLNRLYELFVSVTYFPSDKSVKNEEFNVIRQTITEQFDYLHLEDKVLHLNVIENKENGRDDALIFLFKLEIYTQKALKAGDKFKRIEVSINGKKD